MTSAKPRKDQKAPVRRKRTILAPDSVLDLVDKYKGTGRPSKLNAETLAKMETACRMATSIEVMADLLGVDPETIMRWRKKDPRLKVQMNIWKASGLQMVNRRLWEKATNGDRWAIEFILRFRHPDYARQMDGAVGGMANPLKETAGTGDEGSVDFSYL